MFIVFKAKVLKVVSFSLDEKGVRLTQVNGKLIKKH